MQIRPPVAAVAAVVAMLFGALAAVGNAVAAPRPTPTPGPASTSSIDEITDMVMDAVQRPVAPTTTPVPPPPPG